MVSGMHAHTSGRARRIALVVGASVLMIVGSALAAKPKRDTVYENAPPTHGAVAGHGDELYVAKNGKYFGALIFNSNWKCSTPDGSYAYFHWQPDANVPIRYNGTFNYQDQFDGPEVDAPEGSNVGIYSVKIAGRFFSRTKITGTFADSFKASAGTFQCSNLNSHKTPVQFTLKAQKQ